MGWLSTGRRRSARTHTVRLLAVVCGLAWAICAQENGIRDHKDARVELLREERRAAPSPRREARVSSVI